MKRSFRKITLIAVLLPFTCKLSAENIRLQSPDKHISIEIKQDKSNGEITYTAMNENGIFIDKSHIGISINTEKITSNEELYVRNKRQIIRKFPVRGVKSVCNYKANRYELAFMINKTKGEYWLEFDVSNQGIAFRYFYKKNGINHVEDENTTFVIPPKTKVWFAERKNSWKLKSYAGEFINCDISQLNTISPTGSIQCPPLVFEYQNGGYGFISESALYNYSGMRFDAIGNNTLQTNFTEGKTGFDITGTVITPWRVCVVATDLNELVNTDMINGLNPSPDKKLFGNTRWIKPGKALTRFFARGCGTPSEEMHVVDRSSSLKFDYSLIDEGWEKWNEKWENLKSVCDYAKTRNVGIWVWKHSKEINDSLNNYQVLREFLDSVKNCGVCGVKVDYMNGESEKTIDFDISLLRYAAERKLMINLHGCQKPSGECVTYPNELTREGVRGWELNSMQEGPIPASHNAALPFTRYLVGNGDYTPLCYTVPGATTWAQQLATVVCFTSPFLCIPEDPDFIAEDSRVASFNEILKEMPTVWDETRVLPLSKIGELAIMARRYKSNWYIGIINAGDARKIEIPLSLLNGKSYNATIFTDNILAPPVPLEKLNQKVSVELHKIYNVIPYKVEKKEVNKGDILNIEVAQNGGAFVKLSIR
jgi:Glycoside hydrolase 97.